MSSNSPKVSIIVTTKNEEKNIEAFLQSCDKQTYKNIEVIVVDNPTTSDKTSEIAQKYTSKVYIAGPERSAQRNFGIESAEGSYLLVLDADMILTENVVQECIDIINKDPEIKAVVIPEKSIGDSFWAKCKALERTFYFIEGDINVEAARFFEKDALNKVGGYDPSITGPEDWDLPERIYKHYPKRARTKAYILHNEGNVNLWKLIKKKHYYAKLSHVYLSKNKISPIGSKTVYFLRPTFYKNYKLWFKSPKISLGTIVMLTGETIGGGVGFLQGYLHHIRHK